MSAALLAGIQHRQQRQLLLHEAFPELSKNDTGAGDSSPNHTPFGPQPRPSAGSLAGCPSRGRAALLLLQLHPTAVAAALMAPGFSLAPYSSSSLDSRAAHGPEDGASTSGQGDVSLGETPACGSRCSGGNQRWCGPTKRLPWAHLAAREAAAAAAAARQRLQPALHDHLHDIDILEDDLDAELEIRSDGSYYTAHGAGSSRHSRAPASCGADAAAEDLYEPGPYMSYRGQHGGLMDVYGGRYGSGTADEEVMHSGRGWSGEGDGDGESESESGSSAGADSSQTVDWLALVLEQAESQLSSGDWFGYNSDWRASSWGLLGQPRPLPPRWEWAAREADMIEAVDAATQYCLHSAARIPSLERLVSELDGNTTRWAHEELSAGGGRQQQESHQRLAVVSQMLHSEHQLLQLQQACRMQEIAWLNFLDGEETGARVDIHAHYADLEVAWQRLELLCELLQLQLPTTRAADRTECKLPDLQQVAQLLTALVEAMTHEGDPERLRWLVLAQGAFLAEAGAAQHTAAMTLNLALLGCLQIIVGQLGPVVGRAPFRAPLLDPLAAAAAAVCYGIADEQAALLNEANLPPPSVFATWMFYTALTAGPLPPPALDVPTDLLPATAAAPPPPPVLPAPLSSEHIRETIIRVTYCQLSTQGWVSYLHAFFAARGAGAGAAAGSGSRVGSEEKLRAALDNLFAFELLEHVRRQQRRPQEELLAEAAEDWNLGEAGSEGEAETGSGAGAGAGAGAGLRSARPEQGQARTGPAPRPAGSRPGNAGAAVAATAPRAGTAAAGGPDGELLHDVRRWLEKQEEEEGAWLLPLPPALHTLAVSLLQGTREVLALATQPTSVLRVEAGGGGGGGSSATGKGRRFGPVSGVCSGGGDATPVGGSGEFRCRLQLEGPELAAALAILFSERGRLSRDAPGDGAVLALWLPEWEPPPDARRAAATQQQQQQQPAGVKVEFVRCSTFNATSVMGGGSVAVLEQRKQRMANNLILITDKHKPADAAKQVRKLLKEFGAGYLHSKGPGGVLRALQTLARVRHEMRQADEGRDVVALITGVQQYGDTSMWEERRKANEAGEAAAGEAGRQQTHKLQKTEKQARGEGQVAEQVEEDAEPVDGWSLHARVDDFVKALLLLEQQFGQSRGSEGELDLEIRLGQVLETSAGHVLLPLLPPPLQGHRGSGAAASAAGAAAAGEVAAAETLQWIQQVAEAEGSRGLGEGAEAGGEELGPLLRQVLGSARRDLVVEWLVLTCSPGRPTEFHLPASVAATAEKILREEKLTKDVAL